MPIPRRRQGNRLLPILIVPFVLQTAIAMGLVSYIYFQTSKRTINDLAAQVRSELTARIERELSGYFTSPHNINQLNAAAFMEGEFDFEDPQNAHQMFQQFQFTPFLFGLYCGTEQGEFLGVGAREFGGEAYLQNLSQRTNYRFHYYKTDSQGNRLSFVADDGPYDPRQRPWYQAAVAAQRPTWSDIYLDFATFLPTITAARPVYGQDGSLLGVCATDVSTPTEFRRFLAELQIGKTGQAFVVDTTGRLISSSTDEPLTVGNGNDSVLLTANQSESELIRNTAAYLQGEFGSWDKIQRSQQLDFTLNRQKYFVQVLPFRDTYGLDWLIVVTIPEADFMAGIYQQNRNALLLMIVALSGATAIAFWTARRIMRPIARLSQATQDIAAGRLNPAITSSNILELEGLNTSFQTMAHQLKNNFLELQQREQAQDELLQAYSRFVPNQYLDFLQVSSVTEIQVGDHVQREMSILFADIRNFTRMSEQMTPDQTFEFINIYLAWMESAISDNNGFIDKYIGDAIMALFPGSPEDALNGGIAMLQKLKQYNLQRIQRGQIPIEIGIGINTGTLMLGTVGGENRMDSTVISDAVNLASRIEDLTKEYKIPLLISQHTYDRLAVSSADSPLASLSYQIRELDRVRVRGKSESVTIYEVFDADPFEVKVKKQETLGLFERAVAQYRLRAFDQAESLFNQCLDLNPEDQGARVYLSRCQQKYYSFQVSVLESSFALIKNHPRQFTDRFYEKLFERIPETRQMFAHTDFTQQKQKLWNSIELVCENLRRPELLSGVLKGLGATHVQYGVKAEHYALAGEVFLATFEECLNESWTDEVKQAWGEAYDTIQTLMVTGAEEVLKIQAKGGTPGASPG